MVHPGYRIHREWRSWADLDGQCMVNAATDAAGTYSGSTLVKDAFSPVGRTIESCLHAGGPGLVVPNPRVTRSPDWTAGADCWSGPAPYSFAQAMGFKPPDSGEDPGPQTLSTTFRPDANYNTSLPLKLALTFWCNFANGVGKAPKYSPVTFPKRVNVQVYYTYDRVARTLNDPNYVVNAVRATNKTGTVGGGYHITIPMTFTANNQLQWVSVPLRGEGSAVGYGNNSSSALFVAFFVPIPMWAWNSQTKWLMSMRDLLFIDGQVYV